MKAQNIKSAFPVLQVKILIQKEIMNYWYSEDCVLQTAVNAENNSSSRFEVFLLLVEVILSIRFKSKAIGTQILEEKMLKSTRLWSCALSSQLQVFGKKLITQLLWQSLQSEI